MSAELWHFCRPVVSIDGDGDAGEASIYEDLSFAFSAEFVVLRGVCTCFVVLLERDGYSEFEWVVEL